LGASLQSPLSQPRVLPVVGWDVIPAISQQFE
ncbi:MAG: hypothetical protein ACI9W6_000404, partial [Motiliproteus sp.]